MTRPVRARTVSARPAASSASQVSAVRRHCHTMALWMGSPVARSHTTVVSRWLVTPIAATSAGAAPASSSTACAVASCVAQISPASCSTQPGRGEMLRKFALRNGGNAARAVEKNTAGTRRALVQGKHILRVHARLSAWSCSFWGDPYQYTTISCAWWGGAPSPPDRSQGLFRRRRSAAPPHARFWL